MSTRTGAVDALKLFKIFRSLQEQRLTGLLSFERGQIKKRARVLHGAPTRVASNARRETAVGALLEQGFLSPDDVTRATASRDGAGGTIEAALVRLGLIDAAQLVALESRLARRRLLEVFTWTEGSYTFTPSDLTPEPAERAIDVTALLLEASAKVVPQATCAAFVSDYTSHTLASTPLMETHGASFDAMFPGGNVRSALRDGATVETLRAHFQDAERVQRQVFALVIAGLVTFRQRTEAYAALQQPTRAPAAVPEASARPAVSPAAGRPSPPASQRVPVAREPPRPRAEPAARAPKPLDDAARAKLAEVSRLASALGTQNHYELLGVARDADAKAVSSRFKRLALDFHVDRFAKYGLEPEVAKQIQTVFMALNRAHEVLGNEEKRKEYDAQLSLAARGHSVLGSGGAPDVGQIFKAEQHVRDGVLQMRNGNVDAARQRFADALRATPGDVVAVSGIAFADFLTAHSQKNRSAAATARQQLEEATRENEARDEPFVYLGRMYKALGDMERAAAAFKRALDINARCAEAASELRHLQRRVEGSTEKPATGGLFGRKKT